ncbi:MAG: hypothetical protein WBI47_00960, partial [Atribacterales bacterium]
YGPLIELFRGDKQGDNRGIQGIHPRRHSRNLLSGIHVFAFSFGFCLYVFVFSGGLQRGAAP